MQILEHGQEQEQTLLFFPCTAEPVWAFPPERFTLPGHDPVKEYDTMEVYLKTYSDRTIHNVFWSGNNYALPQPRHIVAVSPGEVPWNDEEKARMQALNDKDVSIDYAFMVTVEKFMRHGVENVPDYMISGSRGDFTGAGDIHFFYSADEVLTARCLILKRRAGARRSPIRHLPGQRWYTATACCRFSGRRRRILQKSRRF